MVGPARMERNLSLQAVRGISALAVVASHLPYAFGRSDTFPYILRVGSIAVFVFFCLSGIVISTSHGKEAFGNGPWGGRTFIMFAAKRLFRLYPAFLAVLALECLVENKDLGQLIASIPLISVWGSRSSQILPPAWSLYYEIFFYILFALLLLDRRIGWTVCIFVAAGTLQQAMREGPEPLPFSHLNLYFATGVILVLLRPRLPRISAGAALFAFVPFACAEFSATEAAVNAWSLIGCIILFAPLLSDWGATVPSTLVYLGEISYALYLVHWPVQVALLKLHPFHTAWGMCLALLLAPLPMAVILHHGIEKPCIRLGSKWLARRRHSRIPVMAA
ncbi:MAG TPA: acyltransferase [Candidatus Methylacidiphilales bacterium]